MGDKQDKAYKAYKSYIWYPYFFNNYNSESPMVGNDVSIDLNNMGLETGLETKLIMFYKNPENKTKLIEKIGETILDFFKLTKNPGRDIVTEPLPFFLKKITNEDIKDPDADITNFHFLKLNFLDD